MSRPKQKKSGTRAKRRGYAAPKPRKHREWQLFCDEAGNAGSNWLDAEQPYHVEAGWLVRPSKRDGFEEVLRRAISATQASELKGSTLLRRTSGVQTITKVLRELGQHAMPFFVIADRSFCVAAKAVDVFLDPLTNPAAEWLPTSAFQRRREITATVSSLAEATLSLFARAYREPTSSGFADAAAAIASDLRLVNAAPILVESFMGAVDYASTICAYETLGSGDASHGVVTALNTPMFLHLLKKADRVMDTHEGDKLIVVHDEVARFDRVLGKAVTSLSFPSGSPVEFSGLDGEIVRMGLRNVARFEIATSTTSFGVQAADLLAATVAKLAREVREGRAWSPELRELAKLTLPALLDDDPPFAGFLGHRQGCADLLRPLFEEPRS